MSPVQQSLVSLAGEGCALSHYTASKESAVLFCFSEPSSVLEYLTGSGSRAAVASEMVMNTSLSKSKFPYQ